VAAAFARGTLAASGIVSPVRSPILTIAIRVVKWIAIAVCSLWVAAWLVAFWGMSGYGIPGWPRDTEVTHQKPFADVVGREYQVAGVVEAYAWNDFPDKERILGVSLMSPPGVKNRFVSYVIPLKLGHKMRIVSAWRSFTLFGFAGHYVVSIRDAGLPEGIEVTMSMNADGIPDPQVHPIDDGTSR
jgi:hypothetical protein